MEKRRDYGPVQLANYLRACWPEAKGSVDRALFFGLLPGPDRARGRWSAALAEEVRSRWPEIAAAAGCIGAPGLKERGWTESMIRSLLGKPDLYADNPYYKSAAPMRLWRLRRAEVIEGTPEFAAARERAERRCAAAAKAAETRAVFKALAGLGQSRPGGYGHRLSGTRDQDAPGDRPANPVCGDTRLPLDGAYRVPRQRSVGAVHGQPRGRRVHVVGDRLHPADK